MPEKYHGWTITQHPPAKGDDRYTVRAQSPKPGDYIDIQTAEMDDTMGFETAVIRLKNEIAMLEFSRNRGEEQRAWAKRLAQAARDQDEHRTERRLRAAAAAGAKESDEEIIHRLTGAKMNFKGVK